jgi:hypothetical protein
MNKELEEHQASPELQKFFENLLDLKKHIKDILDVKVTEVITRHHLEYIYSRLHVIIKEKD